MKWNKDDTYGLIGTLLFHAALFLVLWFTVIRAAIPEEDGGVLVNFGNIDSAAGTFEPQYTGQVLPEETTTPPPPTPVPPVETPKEDLLTQDMEESVSLDDQRKEEEKRKAEEERKRKEAEEQERIRKEKEAEAKRLAEERRKQAEAISNKVAGAFGIGAAEGNSQGDAAEGVGNQGILTGNSDHGAMEGFGGNGKYDYSLAGRKFVGEVRLPSDLETEEGKIVVDIMVDPRGNVIGASIGKGTTIDNAIMRREAISAAKKNKFNSIDGSNNQYGSITFIYKIK